MAGEIISVLGAMVILLLEVTISPNPCTIFFTPTSCRVAPPPPSHAVDFPLLCVRQIPDILRVGAKRYFGQTALGGPFHVILCVENVRTSAGRCPVWPWVDLVTLWFVRL